MGGNYMGDNVTLSITILLTGFAVVFSVLLILIGIIKLYGTVIYNIQNRGREKKAARNVDLPKAEREPEPAQAQVQVRTHLFPASLTRVLPLRSLQVVLRTLRRILHRRSSALRMNCKLPYNLYLHNGDFTIYLFVCCL